MGHGIGHEPVFVCQDSSVHKRPPLLDVPDPVIEVCFLIIFAHAIV